MKDREIQDLTQVKHELQRALIETEAVEVSLLGFRRQTDLLRQCSAHLKAAITALRDVEKGRVHSPLINQNHEPRREFMRTVIAGLFAGLAAASLLTGCAYIGNIDTVNQHAVAFTSRSALQVQRGDSHEASALRDLDGGGAVTPQTTLTK